MFKKLNINLPDPSHPTCVPTLTQEHQKPLGTPRLGLRVPSRLINMVAEAGAAQTPTGCRRNKGTVTPLKRDPSAVSVSRSLLSCSAAPVRIVCRNAFRQAQCPTTTGRPSSLPLSSHLQKAHAGLCFPCNFFGVWIPVLRTVLMSCLPYAEGHHTNVSH